MKKRRKKDHELVDAEAERTHKRLVNLSGFSLREVSDGIRVEIGHYCRRRSRCRLASEVGGKWTNRRSENTLEEKTIQKSEEFREKH